jgi:hypothetical protein
MWSAVIVASGHLSPRLAELTEFLLAATMLVTPPLLRRRRRLVTIIDRAQENSEYVRRMLKKKQPEFAALLELPERELPYPPMPGHGFGESPAALPDGACRWNKSGIS